MSRAILMVLAVAVVVASCASALASCVAPGGAGGCFATIQAAVDAAAPGDEIDVAAGTYTDGVSLRTNKRLTIRGAGVGSTVLDGAMLGFDSILTVANGVRVSIEDMTLQNGTGYQGGAVFVGGGRVTIALCRVTGNQSGSGGGVYVDGGRLTVVDSTVDGNMAKDASFLDQGGGGLYVRRGNLELRRSTVSGNTAAGRVGGIFVESEGRALIVDSTISGNSAPEGAAVICERCRGLRFVSSTVTANSTTSSYIPSGAVETGGKAMIAGSIVALNTSPGPGPDCSGPLRSRGYNLLGGPGVTAGTFGCDLVNDDPTNLIGIDPMLGPLANNGGPTQTHALLAGSPAIDAGDPRPAADRAMRCPTTDQRGVARNGRCDIGAYEF